jgi:hypothetical protein
MTANPLRFLWSTGPESNRRLGSCSPAPCRLTTSARKGTAGFEPARPGFGGPVPSIGAPGVAEGGGVELGVSCLAPRFPVVPLVRPDALRHVHPGGPGGSRTHRSRVENPRSCHWRTGPSGWSPREGTALRSLRSLRAAECWRSPPRSEPSPLSFVGGDGSSPVHHFQGPVGPYGADLAAARPHLPTHACAAAERQQWAIKMEPPRGIEPRSRDYETRASPAMLRGRCLQLWKARKGSNLHTVVQSHVPCRLSDAPSLDVLVEAAGFEPAWAQAHPDSNRAPYHSGHASAVAEGQGLEPRTV